MESLEDLYAQSKQLEGAKLSLAKLMAHCQSTKNEPNGEYNNIYDVLFDMTVRLEDKISAHEYNHFSRCQIENRVWTEEGQQSEC